MSDSYCKHGNLVSSTMGDSGDLSTWTAIEASDGQWLRADPVAIETWTSMGSPPLTGAQWLDVPARRGGCVCFTETKEAKK